MAKVELKKLNLPNGEILGYREGGHGKPILLIHGNLVSSRHWGTLLERLSESYKVYAVDIRGAGVSSYNKSVDTFDDWASDIKLFCDELDLKDFLLVGWSMGGGISQNFIVNYPGYANKLLLLESIPCSGYPYHKKGANGEFLPECYENKEGLLEDKIQLKPMIDSLENNNREFMKYLWDQLVFNLEKPDPEEYSALLGDIYMTRNLRDAAWAAHIFNISHINNGVVDGNSKVDEITLPVLILAGDSDIIVPSNLGEFTSNEIGENSKVEILHGCGHAPHYDNPELVLSKIVDFYGI